MDESTGPTPALSRTPFEASKGREREIAAAQRHIESIRRLPGPRTRERERERESTQTQDRNHRTLRSKNAIMEFLNPGTPSPSSSNAGLAANESYKVITSTEGTSDTAPSPPNSEI